MLIDYTYFFGEISIGQLSSKALIDNVTHYPVREKLNWLINQYEPKYLEGVLGYSTYKALKAGLLVDPVASKWSDLLYGAEYTDIYGNLQKWKGLVRLPEGNISILSGDGKWDIVVGRGRDAYDPIDVNSTTTTTIIPPGLRGQNFVFMQRGFGPLREDEYEISEDGKTLTLLGGSIFSNGDTYFYFGDSTLISSSDADELFKLSPIAYYVYYWYQRTYATNTGGIGESNANAENATRTSPATKQMTAWNRMAEMSRELYAFLYANRTIYTDWDSWQSVYGYDWYSWHGWNWIYCRNEFTQIINPVIH